MDFYYSIEKNIQIIISLLKSHGVRKVVASPGATNVCLIESMRYDGSFEMYSCVDERSAAYIACGLAAESGEPVVLTCTGATASRNYLPGLTEAFYRKLPVIAITASMHFGRIGQAFPQTMDRRTQLNDIVVQSFQLPLAQNKEDEWANNLAVNNAILKSKEGPVHINWVTECSTDYSIKELPDQRVIRKYTVKDKFPAILSDCVAIFIGAHLPFSSELTEAVDQFCEKYNGVVLCDQTSNYRGKYRVLGNLMTYQELNKNALSSMPLMIHLGDISGSYMRISPKQVWRINPDGESRDYFKAVTNIFAMEEVEFFQKYVNDNSFANKGTAYYQAWKNTYNTIKEKIPDVPFSNIWMAQESSMSLPKNSVLHLGILNSLRAWNFFETHESIKCYSNTGGFGIDGVVSTLIGASLANPNKIYFGWLGDLAFFYDMNSIGNRHVGNNVRLAVINNGRGTEFRNYNHNGAIFGAKETDQFVAAAYHYGNQSHELLKHYAQDLGFEYLTASSKAEFMRVKDRFFTFEITEHPILLEVFTNSEDESNALKMINTLEVSVSGSAKNAVRKILGEKGIKSVKNIFGQ